MDNLGAPLLLRILAVPLRNVKRMLNTFFSSGPPQPFPPALWATGGTEHLLCSFLFPTKLYTPTMPNLASKTGSKSMVFGAQETSHVATLKNAENCTTLQRKLVFCLPRTVYRTPSLSCPIFPPLHTPLPCPTWPPKCGPNMSKSMVFGAQETSHVATLRNAKIYTTLERKLCFCLPRISWNLPTILQKNDLKSFLCWNVSSTAT